MLPTYVAGLDHVAQHDAVGQAACATVIARGGHMVIRSVVTFTRVTLLTLHVW